MSEGLPPWFERYKAVLQQLVTLRLDNSEDRAELLTVVLNDSELQASEVMALTAGASLAGALVSTIATITDQSPQVVWQAFIAAQT